MPADNRHRAALVRPSDFVSVLLLTVAALSVSQAAQTASGEATFEVSCSVCHGAGGRPDANSPVVQGLGVVPADFSDPLFNSREPAGDWEMVIRHGGGALGLADQMPPHGDVLSDEQIDEVTRYAKSLADTTGFPPGEMNLMLPIRTRKAFPEDEVVYQGRFEPVPGGDDEWKNVLEIEKRVGKRGQVIVEFVHEAAGGSGELSEIEVGYKQALSFSKRHILSAAAIAAVPVDGSARDGELQTYLAFGRVLSPLWTLQSSLALKFPFEQASDGEIELAGIVHYTHSPWPRRVFPALEVTAVVPYRSRNGDPDWAVMPQARFGLTRGGHVALNVGVELPLSDQAWDYRAYVTLLWDFADGSFFQGW